jgi:PHD/YefM family antitoxin component YafN of YafNO toxin-antitoxin module
MTTPTKEQYIIDAEGNKTAIILSIEQYEQMLEDLHDLAIVAERRTEQPISLANMQEWLKEDGPL